MLGILGVLCIIYVSVILYISNNITNTPDLSTYERLLSLVIIFILGFILIGVHILTFQG